MPKLKMLTGLCGPTISLVRGDEHECDEREASGLIRAGFAVALDGFEPLPLDDEPEAPADETVDQPAADAEPAAVAEPVADVDPATGAEPAADAEPKSDAEPAADAQPAAAPAPAARRRRS